MTRPEYMTTAEVAAVIRRSEDYVARQCAAGEMRGKKLGTQWRIHRDEVTRFMNADAPAAPTRPTRRRAS